MKWGHSESDHGLVCQYRHHPHQKIRVSHHTAISPLRCRLRGIGRRAPYEADLAENQRDTPFWNDMAIYCIGDIQGCDSALGRLLDSIGFSPSRDTVYLLGDLVNRRPDSAAVLRRSMRHGDAIRCLLGNHDLHLLAAAAGARKPSRRDTLTSVLDAPHMPMTSPKLLWSACHQMSPQMS